jgi:type IV pilus assembly protein PilY1
MNRKSFIAVLGAIAALAAPFAVQAQSQISEDFTRATTTNSWWFFNGACLTASTLSGAEPTVSAGVGSGGQIPGCTTIASSYYNKTAGEKLVGGWNGTFPDPNIPAPAAGEGALRFTNGYPYGYTENGGVIFATPFPTGQGVSITFKTVTYLGNSGGAGLDGADGISFFLMDATQLNTSMITGVSSGNGNGLGSWGGSLAYTCSNSNPPYNGLIGGYLGLGIDEYGNFLNGTTNTLAETGTTATGDNTASGGGYQPGRIGIRGAGNIAWNTLTGAYGSNPNSSSKPYYPASLATSCAISGGAYDSTANSCATCPANYTLSGNSCTSTMCSSGTYNASLNQCETCNTGTYNSSANACEVCNANYTYNSGTNECTRAGHANETPTASSPTSSAPESTSPSTGGNPDSYYAVQNTCATGDLWNYSTATAPTSAGAASLTNAVNTGNATATPAIAPILDYTAQPGGYIVLPAGTQIANETATTRPAATPIYYQLKISQNGLLSLSYSICPPSSGCGAFISVIKSQNITTANGPLPANFLFGFAGSTGGSSNIHEILCFQAEPATAASASAGASEKQSAKLETGTQAYFAYYNPTNGWTGRVTASSLSFDQYGNVIIATTPNWDASCVLTGVSAASTCSTTGVPGPTAAEAATSRVILSWNGSAGIPFEWGNLTTGANGQQAALNAGDTSGSPALSSLTCPVADPVTGAAAGAAYQTQDRLDFLRGDRACEINSAGTGLFRRRTSVLADIIDSSPTWVGAPDAPYAAVWSDRINSADPLPENSAAVSYPGWATAAAEANRQQVVYVGANDGLLHGFRSGVYNTADAASCAANPTPNCGYTNNDGYELLAYMPGAVVQNALAATPGVDLIHSSSNAQVDYSNSQYGHQFWVDATPGTGDLFFNGQWHTWLVGGLGPGGAAIYALDVTNPTNFSETNAASLVMGEWNSSTITCVGNATCGTSLGNTYGTPQIRRLHDGKWAIIFGNGIGSASGDGGIFIGVLNTTTGTPLTFYYLSTKTGSAASPNGIAFTTPVDLDGDHISDYVYAGDIQGNLWRFDLTSATETTWAVTPGPLFKAPAGQPITTAPVVASGAPSPGMEQQVMVLFGTGQKFPLSNVNAATYATGTQSLYGVWDWNMSGWNALSTTAQYASLAAGSTGLGGANHTINQANLQAQTVTVNTTTGDRDINSNATICWAGQTGCTGAAAQYGWYLNLPGTQEQVIYSPELVLSALTVNTIVPAANTPTSCTILSDQGYTYVLSALTGGAFNEVFLPPSEAQNPGVNTNQAYLDQHAIGMLTNATGSSFITSNSSGTEFLVYETNQAESGTGNSNLQGGSLGLNLPPNTTGRRLSWIELR